ncbi:BQ2448_5948 [Microbotryum intermedium]|uniref:BQ2448_5948 protein n=1 Tax=Microbotryum intermedium TaxID=269621 RepID=A0A238EZL4_9BASI|nr:BQ2448_5948 [Microbotryum intermedium]
MFVDTKLLALFATACSALASGASAKSGDSNSPKSIPGRYIIAVSSTSGSLSKRASGVAISSVINKIGSTGINVETKKLYQSPGVLTGASIVVPENTTVADLLAIPGVTHAWPVRSVPNPSSLQTSPNNVDSYSSQLVRRDLLERRADDFKDDTFPPHQMTGVDKMHAQGLLGAGIRVAIIDTGVDYKNPILGGCFGKGCKVAFGHSYIDDNGKPISSPDPYTNCSEHGTHVSGIVGANPNKYGFTGVAPKATLGMYRVFPCTGSTSDDVIAEAMLRAPEDNANIVSMSLGGSGSWVDGSATQYIADRLTAKGIHIVVAAGNEQDEGLFFASSPASSRTGLSIASVDVTVVPAYSMLFKTGGYSAMNTFSAKPLGLDTALPIYFTSTDINVTNDACVALPKSTPNLRNYVVAIQRGSCYSALKLTNAAAKGARYVIIYGAPGVESRPFFTTEGTGVVGAAGLTQADGVKLLKYYLAQKKKGPKVAFPSNSKQLRVQQTLSGGQVSDFSQFGPTNDMYGQPSFGAPGGNVLSTFPLSFGGVGVISGTSMASPFVAGSVALLLAARKSDKFTPVEMRQLLSSTAKAIPVKRNTKGPLTSTLLQGAGLIQVNKAVTAKSFFGPNELYLNDTAHFAATQTVTITNKNSKAVTYRYSDTGAQPRLTYDKKGQYNPSLEPPALKRGASVTFRPGRVTVPAGKTTTFQIKFQPPQFSAGQVALFPVYSGFIMITADNKESFQIPYFGLAGSMRDMQILDQTDNFAGQIEAGLRYPFVMGADGAAQFSPTTVKTYEMESGVAINFRLAREFCTHFTLAACRAFNVDLVFANTTFKSTISPGNNAALSRRSIEGAGHELELDLDLGHLKTDTPLADSHLAPRRESQSYDSVPTVGHIYGELNVPRDAAVTNRGSVPFRWKRLNFTGSYNPRDSPDEDATADKFTPYRFLLRAVRTTADPDDEASWESWLSPPFQFS